MQALTTLPPHARPRERLAKQGADGLSLIETVALILGSGKRGVSILELANRVVGSLLTNGPSLGDLAEIPGIGTGKASAIIAAYSLAGKVAQYQAATELTAPERIYAACADILEDPQEKLVAFYVSSRFTILKREVISVGTVDASLIHPREVFRPAILSNASHLVIAHNHPSGNKLPSNADIAVTRRLAEAGEHIGIALLDHLVCTPQGYTSLKIAYPHLFCYAKPV